MLHTWSFRCSFEETVWLASMAQGSWTPSSHTSGSLSEAPCRAGLELENRGNQGSHCLMQLFTHQHSHLLYLLTSRCLKPLDHRFASLMAPIVYVSAVGKRLVGKLAVLYTSEVSRLFLKRRWRPGFDVAVAICNEICYHCCYN